MIRIVSKITSVIALIVFFTIPVKAQILSAKLVGNTVKQYQKAEFNLSIIATWQNPYLQQEVMVDMLIISPTAKHLVLPCYYEQGQSGKTQLWKARFTPQEAGPYKYQVRLLTPSGDNVVSRKFSFISKRTARKGFLHPNDNWTFKFDNGERFRGIGENIGWESRASDDSKYFKELHQQPKYNYDYMLRSLDKHGGNFYRTWISRWNLPLDWHNDFNSTRYQASNNYFNPSAIKRMDKLVNLSDSLKVYMMLTLGMGAYETKDGGFSATAADFFVNPKSKERYKNRLRYIIARWGYSPSIAAWELFNEVDNVQFANKDKPISADSIVAWHDEMSTYIKSIDPYQHMVTTSISHRDLAGLNSLKNIDFNQKHIYKNTAVIPDAITKYEANFKKPYVIGEYGYEWDWSKNFNDFAPQMDDDFKRGLWYGLFSPTPILPMSWWWEYFDNRGTDKYFVSIKRVNEWMQKNKPPFETVEVKTTMSNVNVMALKSGTEYFVYVYNHSNEKQTGTLTLLYSAPRNLGGSEFQPDGDILELANPLIHAGKNITIEVDDLATHTDRIYWLR